MLAQIVYRYCGLFVTKVLCGTLRSTGHPSLTRWCKSLSTTTLNFYAMSKIRSQQAKLRQALAVLRGGFQHVTHATTHVVQWSMLFFIHSWSLPTSVEASSNPVIFPVSALSFRILEGTNLHCSWEPNWSRLCRRATTLHVKPSYAGAVLRQAMPCHSFAFTTVATIGIIFLVRFAITQRTRLLDDGRWWGLLSNFAFVVYNARLVLRGGF